MRRKTAGRVHHQRECVWCHGGIPDSKPVFLVGEPSGQIIGPFHAGCAETIALRAKATGQMPGVPGATNYGTWPSAREETLPE